MKQLLQPLRWALPALLLGSFGANAQALNYAVAGATNTAGTFTDLGTTGTAIATANNDDANSTAQAIGFTFSFNGATFTQFVLSTNGLIKLGATAPSAANLFLCNTAGCTTVSPVTSPDPADVNLVMPFNFDLEPGTGGAASYRVLTSGTAPNRVCTVQWKNVKDKADATPANTQYDNFTFQAKLYETTNNIEFVYGPAVASTATAQSRFPVVGIKGSGAASGQTVLGSKTTGAAAWTATTFITGNYTGSTHNFRNASLPDAGRTYRFTPGTTGPATPPTNDNCSGAIALTIGATCTPVTGDNTNGTASPATVPAPGACAGTTTGATNDIWYRVVVPASGSVTVTTSAVTGSGFSDSVLQLFSGTCGSLTEVGCNDDATGLYSSVSVTGQTPGATLYARIMGYSAAIPNGPIGICATGSAPTTCGDPTAAQIANVTATSAQITFTAGAGNVSYNVTYTPTGGTTTTVTPNPTASPITISGLTASTTYAITIQSVCAAGATGAVLSGTFTTLSGLPAPANDDPTGAVVLPVSTTCNPVNSTNVASTTTTPNGYVNPNPAAAGCGVAVNPRDVWFSFTATSAAATVTVTGAPAGLLRTFSAASSAGPFTQVGCAAGTTNNTVSAPLALTGLTAGTVYYISVSGYGSGDTQGAFTICVTGAGPATCNPVTNLAATASANGRTATVSFTPAATGTSYSVTYQTVPAGTVNTVTPSPTASPVVINGLAGNSTYLITVVSNCAGGLTSSSASTTVRTITAAREALGNGSLSVFPNPASKAFTVGLPALAGERTATVVLLNALGQSVYSRNVELNAAGTQARVDVSSLAKGIYTLRVKTSSQSATKSVVVE